MCLGLGVVDNHYHVDPKENEKLSRYQLKMKESIATEKKMRGRYLTRR